MKKHLGQDTGEIAAELNTMMFQSALAGCKLRKLKARGDGGPAATGINDVRARVLINFSEELETAVRSGMPLDDALDYLKAAGWLDSLVTHELTSLV